MRSPHEGSPTRPVRGRTLAAWAALALGWVLPLTGCQVEYAGMTLPSGKYMHDDVQYFPPGPDFPWANTQAATQRARMQAMGMDIPGPGQGGPLTVTPAQGAEQPVQNQLGRPTAITGPLEEVVPVPGPNAAPGAQPPPGAVVPPPPGPGGAVPPPPGAGEANAPPGPDAGVK